MFELTYRCWSATHCLPFPLKIMWSCSACHLGWSAPHQVKNTPPFHMHPPKGKFSLHDQFFKKKLLKNTICTIMSEFLRIFNSVYFLFQSLGWLYAIAIYVYQRWIIVEVGKLLCSYSSRSQLVPEASGFENKLLAYLNSVSNCQHLTASGKKANPWKCQGAHKENQKAEMIR